MSDFYLGFFGGLWLASIILLPILWNFIDNYYRNKK